MVELWILFSSDCHSTMVNFIALKMYRKNVAERNAIQKQDYVPIIFPNPNCLVCIHKFSRFGEPLCQQNFCDIMKKETGQNLFNKTVDN